MSTRWSIQLVASGGTNSECSNCLAQNRTFRGLLHKAPRRILAPLPSRNCHRPWRYADQKSLPSKPFSRAAPLIAPTFRLFVVRNPIVPTVTAGKQHECHSLPALKRLKFQTHGDAAQLNDIMPNNPGTPGGAHAASPQWQDILQLQNKNVRDLASVIGCPRLLQPSVELPLVPDDVFGAAGARWEDRLHWLRSLDPTEVDAWFATKRRTRLGYHFADCVEFLLRFSPAFHPPGLHVSQQVFQRQARDVTVTQADDVTLDRACDVTSSRGGPLLLPEESVRYCKAGREFTPNGEDGLGAGVNGAIIEEEECVDAGHLFKSRNEGSENYSKIAKSRSEHMENGRVVARSRCECGTQDEVTGVGVGGSYAESGSRGESIKSGQKDRDSGLGSRLGKAETGETSDMGVCGSEVEVGNRAAGAENRQRNEEGPETEDRSEKTLPAGRRKSKRQQRKAGKQSGKTITVGEFDILFLQSTAHESRPESTVICPGHVQEEDSSGESALEGFIGRYQDGGASAGVVGVEHWELSVKFLLYIGPESKLFETGAISGSTRAVDTKGGQLSSDAKSRGFGAVTSAEADGMRQELARGGKGGDGLLREKAGSAADDVSRESPEVSRDGADVSEGGVSRDGADVSEGGVRTEEEDLLYYFVGPHAGERLSDRRDRIAKQLRLSDDPEAKLVLADLFLGASESNGLPSESYGRASGMDSGASEMDACWRADADASFGERSVEELSGDSSLRAPEGLRTGGRSGESTSPAAGLSSRDLSETEGAHSESGCKASSSSRGSGVIVVTPRAFVKGYLFYEQALWKRLVGRGSSEVGLENPSGSAGPSDGPKPSDCAEIPRPSFSQAATNLKGFGGAASLNSTSSEVAASVLLSAESSESVGRESSVPTGVMSVPASGPSNSATSAPGSGARGSRGGTSASLSASSNDLKAVFLTGEGTPGESCRVAQRAELNPGHWVGWWTCDIRKFLGDPSFRESRWYIIPKMEWLSPVVIRPSAEHPFDESTAKETPRASPPAGGRPPLSNRCTSTALTSEELAAASHQINGQDGAFDGAAASLVSTPEAPAITSLVRPGFDTVSPAGDLDALRAIGAVSGEPTARPTSVESASRLLSAAEFLLQIEALQAVAEQCKVPRRGRVLVAEMRRGGAASAEGNDVSISEADGEWREVSRGFVVESTWPMTGELPIMFP